MAIPGLPGGLIIYQGHLFPLKGHLWPSIGWANRGARGVGQMQKQALTVAQTKNGDPREAAGILGV